MPNIDLQETQEELQWLEKKLDIKANRVIRARRRPVRRGEVYGCDFGYNIGSELRGYHPCVIVENNATSANRHSICVVPITHAANRQVIPASLVPITRQADQSGNTIVEGFADVAGIRTVSKARLTTKKTVLPASDMLEIDKQLATLTDLYSYYSDLNRRLATAQQRGNAKEEKARKLRALLIEAEKELPDSLAGDLRQRITDALKL